MLTIPSERIKIQQAIVQKHQITPRHSWGRYPPRYDQLVLDWDYDSLVIHHSGNAGEKDPTGIERRHCLEQGYDDVGYHYLIHPSGKIFEGRAIIYKGAHVNLKNTGKIGLLMMGDYDEQWWDDDDTLTRPLLETLESLLVTLTSYFPTKYLGGHKEFLRGQKYTCPGNLLMPVVETWRKKFSLQAPP